MRVSRSTNEEAVVLGRRILMVGIATLILAAPGAALADSGGSPASAFGPAPVPPASGWQIGYYTPSAIGTLSYAQAFKGAGEASLNFTSADNTALLITGQKAKYPSLLGDLSGKSSVSVSLTVGNVTGVFTYYGEPSCAGPPPDLGPAPNVRFYFQTSNAGGFNETHYWWSNPVSWPLIANGSMSLTNDLNGAHWSDYFGHFGNDPSYSAGFAAALSNVTDIGVSFGGGCFFENGVGTTDGSGTFTINTFTVS
jgi:hypothetical protein